MYNFAARVLSNRKIQIIVILLLAVLAAVSVYAGAKNAIAYSQDFQWDATKALVDGYDPYEISLDETGYVPDENLADFYRLFTDAGLKQKMEANQFPSLLLLLVPYTIFAPMTARVLWLISNICFTVGILWLLRKTFFAKCGAFECAVMFLLMIAGTPFRNQIGVGQHTLFSFFFFMLAVWLDEKNPEKNSVPITICMFISYFKYTLTAPLTLYLLYRRRYKEFAASVVMHIIATVLAAIMLNKSVIYMIVAPLKVASVLGSQGGLDLGAVFGGGIAGYAVGAIVAAALVVITLMLPKGHERLLFAVLLLWSLILTYHRTYDFFVMSAMSVFTAGAIEIECNEQLGKIMRVWFYVLLFMIYFALRVFHENIYSRIVIGLVYYVFTVIVTVMIVRCIKNKDVKED